MDVDAVDVEKSEGTVSEPTDTTPLSEVATLRTSPTSREEALTSKTLSHACIRKKGQSHSSISVPCTVW